MPSIGANIAVGSRGSMGGGVRLGADLISNGGFDSDTVWIKGVGWTIGGGVASATNVNTAAALVQGIAIAAATTYKIRIEVSNYVGGVCQIWLGAVYSGVEINGNGVFTAEVTTGDPLASSTLSLEGYTNFTADLDNITVKEIL